MTLPFNNSERKIFQCFVCGISFSFYEEFKNHVIDEHREGVEYVTCKQCCAPVRDLRLHYKVLHPQRELPKDGQMRATVWYDFTGKKRKRDKSKPNFEEGYLTSFKNAKQLHYRSGYEKQVYMLLEEKNDVAKYEVEPKDCMCKYWFNGKYRKYWPDLKVIFTDGHTEIWEIKPSNQTDLEQNKAKWDACAEYVGRRGYSFSVKTEQGINKLKKMILEQNKNN